MSSNVRKVRTSGPDRVTGTILRGEPGIAYPKFADLASAFAFDVSGFDDLGFVGDDGVTKSESTDFSRIQEMGGKTVARFLSDYNAQFQATLLELNPAVARMLYGADNVSVIPADTTHGEIIVARAGKKPSPAGPWIIRMVGRDNQRTMYSVPLGQLTTTGDVTHNRSSAAGHQITIETLPDDDGFDFYLFDDDGVTAIAAAPTIDSVLPSGRGTGQQVTIKGTRFSSATGVAFGGVAVAANGFTVVDARTITATLPSGSAGSAPVTVTNPSGTSAGKAYTRAA